MQSVAPAAIGSEVQNPGAAIPIREIWTRAVNGQRVMNCGTPGRHLARYGLAVIHTIDGEGRADLSGARRRKPRDGGAVRNQAGAMRSGNVSHAAVLDRRGLQGDPEVDRTRSDRTAGIDMILVPVGRCLAARQLVDGVIEKVP